MTIKVETFKAELIKHTHRKPELLVTGEVTEPTTGWVVSLERAHPQGINPAILLLRLVEVKPTGIQGDIVTTHAVKYDEHPEKVDYTEVTIEAGSETFSLKVKHSHHAATA